MSLWEAGLQSLDLLFKHVQTGHALTDFNKRIISSFLWDRRAQSFLSEKLDFSQRSITETENFTWCLFFYSPDLLMFCLQCIPPGNIFLHGRDNYYRHTKARRHLFCSSIKYREVALQKFLPSRL